MTAWLSYLLAYGPALLLLVLVAALYLRARRRRQRARARRERLAGRGSTDDARDDEDAPTPDP